MSHNNFDSLIKDKMYALHRANSFIEDAFMHLPNMIPNSTAYGSVSKTNIGLTAIVSAGQNSHITPHIVDRTTYKNIGHSPSVCLTSEHGPKYGNYGYTDCNFINTFVEKNVFDLKNHTSLFHTYKIYSKITLEHM